MTWRKSEKAKRKVSKPVTPERIAELVEKFREYIDKTDLPIISEFAYQNDIDPHLLRDHVEFEYLRKKAIAKKEARLERGLLTGEFNAPGAIFSLKQLGWRDRHDVDIGNRDDKPFKLQKNVDLEKLSLEELEKLEALLEKIERPEGSEAADDRRGSSGKSKA